MSPEETRLLLSTLSAVMDKPVPLEAQAVWAELLAPVPLEWAKMAAMDLLTTSPYWPKPADVINRAKELAAVEKARRKRDQQLALGASIPPEPVPAQTVGPQMIREMLARIAEANKGETDRAKRRLNATMIGAELRAEYGVAEDRPGTPCTNKTCRCTHTEGCDAGWIEVDRGDGVMQAYPCGKCNSRRHGVLTSGSSREAAMRAIRDTSDTKAQEGDAW